VKIEKYIPGFIYDFEVIRDGKVIESARGCHNLIPTAGFNHMIDVVLNGATPYTNWYVGLFTNNYTPIAGDTAETFPASAGEITAYTSANRVALVAGAAAGGAASNVLNKAEFEINGASAVTVRGGFISSSAAKSSTTGVLLSAVRAVNGSNAPIEFLLQPGSILRVTTGLEFQPA
jgi:hypothetical protein